MEAFFAILYILCGGVTVTITNAKWGNQTHDFFMFMLWPIVWIAFITYPIGVIFKKLGLVIHEYNKKRKTIK